MAAFTVQKVPENNKQESYSITVKKSLETPQAVNLQLIDNLFSKGTLPEPILVPGPPPKSVNDKSVKSDKSREKENRELKGMEENDFYPDQSI